MERPSIIPVAASVEWQSKAVTTRASAPPLRYIPHDEWKLVCTLSASEAIRVISLFSLGGRTYWGLQDDPPSPEAILRASFFPSDWTTSDEVQVNFGYSRRTTVTDRALKLDPRVAVEVTAPSAVHTGVPFELARLPGHEIVLSGLALAASDTETRRSHRWVVRPDVIGRLPPAFSGLADGAQSGVLAGI
jgi:hypothetical protein